MSKLIIKTANPLHAASVNIAKSMVAVAITAIDKTLNSITVGSDITPFLDAGREFRITGGTPNDGTYTIKSVVLDGANTVITVNGFGNITDDTVSGSVVYYDAVDKAAKTISVEGDVSADVTAAGAIEVIGASNNVGYYTVVSAVYDGISKTVITVNEDIPSSQVEGEVVYLVAAATIPANSVMFKNAPSKVFLMDFKGGWSVQVKSRVEIGTEEIVITKGNRMFVTTWQDLLVTPAPTSTLDAIDKINALIN